MITTSYVQNDIEDDAVNISSLSELGQLLKVDCLKNGVEIIDIFTAKRPLKYSTRYEDTDIRVLFKLPKKEAVEITKREKTERCIFSTGERAYLNKFGLNENRILYKNWTGSGYSKPVVWGKTTVATLHVDMLLSNLLIIEDKKDEDSVFVLISSPRFPEKIKCDFEIPSNSFAEEAHLKSGGVIKSDSPLLPLSPSIEEDDGEFWYEISDPPKKEEECYKSDDDEDFKNLKEKQALEKLKKAIASPDFNKCVENIKLLKLKAEVLKFVNDHFPLNFKKESKKEVLKAFLLLEKSYMDIIRQNIRENYPELNPEDAEAKADATFYFLMEGLNLPEEIFESIRKLRNSV